jgi:hypothetical protein
MCRYYSYCFVLAIVSRFRQLDLRIKSQKMFDVYKDPKSKLSKVNTTTNTIQKEKRRKGRNRLLLHVQKISSLTKRSVFSSRGANQLKIRPNWSIVTFPFSPSTFHSESELIMVNKQRECHSFPTKEVIPTKICLRMIYSGVKRKSSFAKDSCGSFVKIFNFVNLQRASRNSSNNTSNCKSNKQSALMFYCFCFCFWFVFKTSNETFSVNTPYYGNILSRTHDHSHL